MKIQDTLTNNLKIIISLLFLSAITSCNTLKSLQEDDYLLVENKVFVNDKRTSNLDVHSYIKQRPNQKVLGLPFSLYLYNWAVEDFEKTTEKWTVNHPNHTKFIQTLFSDKQTKEVYLFYKKINKMLQKNEAPIIVSATKTEKSVNTLKKYYENKGYFDVEVNSKEINEKLKKKSVEYHIKTNDPYIINDYTVDIESPVLKKIYNKFKKESFVVEGKQFNRKDFVNEQDRLTYLFRNSGIYSFQKNYIYFEGKIKDSVAKIKKVRLVIKEKVSKRKNTIILDTFRIQKVTKINVYTDYSFVNKNLKYKDSVAYNGLTFYAHHQLLHNPKRLINNIAITPNGVYKDIERKATIAYLNDSKIFESPINIEYVTNKEGNLTANIYLAPLKKFGIDVKADVIHSNVKPFGVLGKFGIIWRNVFKGLEIFELSSQFSFLNIAKDTSSPDFNYFGLTAWEFGVNMAFNIPRILFPVPTNNLIPKRMRPKTTIGISSSFQKNIGLDRQNITGNITYSWLNGKKSKHQLDVLNLQYINNINSPNYFKIFNSELIKLNNVAAVIPDPNMNEGEITKPLEYIQYVLDETNSFENFYPNEFLVVQQVQERKKIITEDILVPTMSYTYTYNGKKNAKDTQFSFVNARFVSVGSITSALAKQKTEDKKELFGLPIAQYIKTEIEYKKYWNLYNHHHLAFRTFVGVAMPFGNSTSIPFSRSYRAGGSNDIRAWKTFELGPGSSQSNLDFNIGNLKLVSNFEYRFKVINNFYGALFVDAGNIWDLTNSALIEENSSYKGWDSIKEIAVGSGFGLRYDFDFLIFRLDVGFKTYEPYLENNKWFEHYNLSHAVYNFGINYPF